jgi:hypothetical protein
MSTGKILARFSGSVIPPPPMDFLLCKSCNSQQTIEEVLDLVPGQIFGHEVGQK